MAKFNDDADGKITFNLNDNKHSSTTPIMIAGFIIGVVIIAVIILFFVSRFLKPAEEISKSSQDNYISENTNSDNNGFIAESNTTVEVKDKLFLDECNIVDSDRYTGNEGDSFVYPIGLHQHSKGNVCVDDTSYEHGIEAWIARWNYSKEKSWAYAVFDLGTEYNSLCGECKLINSYNTSDFNTTLEFWNDSTLIKSYTLTPDSMPLKVEVDVSNCRNLKVYFYDNEEKCGGTSFGLVDMMLSKEKLSVDYSLDYQGNTTNDDETIQGTHLGASQFNSDDHNSFWIQFNEGYRSNRLEMSTFSADEGYRVVWNKNLVCDKQIGKCNQYYYSDAERWEQIGTYGILTDFASEIVASNVDIYDKDGNIIFNKTE